MTLTFLTPLAAVLAVGALVPFLALLGMRRRANRVRGAVDLERPRWWTLVVPVVAVLGAGALLGLAAAQPVLEQTTTRHLRTDAEVFVVIDVSRSMLAQSGLDGTMRIDRAKDAASDLRSALGDVPVGVASITDRTLPHLFPSGNSDVFEATLERSLGIERPPPRSSFATNATKLDSLAAVKSQRFFDPTAEKRLLVVFTDGESLPVANARLGTLFRREPVVESILVHVWGEDERVYTRGTAERQYLPDPSSRAILDSLAASTEGSVFGEQSIESVAQRARQLLGDGPTVEQGQQSGREPLAPYLALAAFLPVGLLLWRRDR